MLSKGLRVIWVFSLLGFMFCFIYIYASLPDLSRYYWNSSVIQISRDTMFHSVMLFASLINAMVFVVRTLFRGRDTFNAWFLGQVTTFNLFFIVVLGIFYSINNGEKNNQAREIYMIYGSVAIMLVWALGGLGVYLKKKTQN